MRRPTSRRTSGPRTLRLARALRPIDDARSRVAEAWRARRMRGATPWRPVRAHLVRLAAAAALVALAAQAAIVPAAADLGGYTIADFHTDLTVLENSDLEVTERITVDFSEPRHGIYRRIPVSYTDPRGFGYSIGLRLLGVEDPAANREWQTSTSREGPYVKIRIGDPDRMVDGRQVYVIRYRVKDALRHFDDHDELYWNAIGDEWQTTIDAASATARLPDSIPPGDITADAFTGRFGGREQAADIETRTSQVDYVTTRSLEPREGLTIVAAWPPGYVRYPSAAARSGRRLFDNWIILAPVAALAALAWTYRRSGRDPQGPASVVVQYEPPTGVSPSEVGALVDETVDLRDITAAVVDLAIKGHLTIGAEERDRFLLGSKEEVTFERVGPAPPQELREHERLVLDGLFESGDRVGEADLREKFYESLPAIREAIYGGLVERGYFQRDPSTVRTLFVVAGVLIGTLAALVGTGWSLLRGGLIPYVLILPIASGVAVGLLVMAFAKAMPRRTEAGVAMRKWALGFQEYVDRVESDRLERAEARNVFEALLPYAMALGVAAKWARKFEGIYDDAPPRWYVGPMVPGHGLSTASLEHNVSSSMAAAAAVMASTPRSSGGSGLGGGGFSGGGFGGGGGGSW